MIKIVCKDPKISKFFNDKSWTKGKTYFATEAGYDKFTVKDNSGVPTEFDYSNLKTHFDIIHDDKQGR